MALTLGPLCRPQPGSWELDRKTAWMAANAQRSLHGMLVVQQSNIGWIIHSGVNLIAEARYSGRDCSAP